MNRAAGWLRVGQAAALLVTLLFAGCEPESMSTSRETNDDAFASLPLVETVDLANAPRVVLATAAAFRDICLERGVDRLLAVRTPPAGESRNGGDGDDWVEYAFVADGVFYVLPAAGYRCPADRLQSELLGIPDCEVYYELKRRGFPYSRHRSYFVE